MEFPVRINKYLSLRGFASRRGADTLVEEGKVFINDTKAILGDLVYSDDTVRVEGKERQERTYIAYYKPVGIVTVGAQEGEREIKDVLTTKYNVFPIGRLDKASCGLILLSNDGRITDRLLHPSHHHEKEYEVVVDKPITHTFITQMALGVDIKGARTRNTKVRRTSKYSFEIVLTEGKNRQIRRMCRALGYEVKELRRFRVENIELGRMKPGQYRLIEGKELDDLLGSLKLER